MDKPLDNFDDLGPEFVPDPPQPDDFLNGIVDALAKIEVTITLSCPNWSPVSYLDGAKRYGFKFMLGSPVVLHDDQGAHKFLPTEDEGVYEYDNSNFTLNLPS